MNQAATCRRQVERKAIAIGADHAAPDAGKRLYLIRATIAVLGFHLLLRTLIFLRQMNY